MSLDSGKVEIVGVDDSYIYLKYHRAKLKEDEQRLIVCHRDDSAYWYDQLRPVECQTLRTASDFEIAKIPEVFLFPLPDSDSDVSYAHT